MSKLSVKIHCLAGHIRRTLIVVSLAAAVPALGLIAYLGLEQRKLIVDEFKRDSLDVVEAVFTLQRQFSDKTKNLLETLDRLLADIPPDDIAGNERILREVLAANPAYVTFAVVDSNGLLVAGAKPVSKNISVANRRYWVLGKQSMRFSAGEYAISHTTEEPVFHFALPRRDKAGEFSGMLVAAVKLNFLEQYLDKFQMPQGGALLLVDNKGIRLLRHPRSPSRPEGEPVASNILELLDKGGASGFFKAPGYDGTPRFYTFMRLWLEGEPRPYGAVVLAVPVKSIETMSTDLLARNMLLLAVAALLALGLARYLGTRALLRPAGTLVQAAKRLGAGNLHPIAEGDVPGGELGVLARSFNEMADSLLLREKQRFIAESALADGEKKFRALFEHTQELIGLLSPEGLLLKANPAALSAAGVDMNSVAGKPFWETPWWNDDPKKQLQLKQAIEKVQSGGVVTFETNHRGAEGQLLHVEFSLQGVLSEVGEPLLLIAEGRDITERYVMESRLRHMALHDPLTGLANRTLLRDRIQQAISWAKRNPKECYSVLFIDIDRFKVINDSLGHASGDVILQQVAARFQAMLREGDTLARYGGDDFVVLVRAIPSARESIRLARRLTKALAQPVEVDGTRVQVSVSIGIELNPPSDPSPDELIRNANLAMHHAKQFRRRRPKAFTARLLENIKSLQFIEQELPEALKNGQFYLVFQPIVDAGRGGALAGFEVLSRWHHPQRGAIAPMEFIRLAEDTGFIITLGEWVLDCACQTLAAWVDDSECASDIFLSVNVSPRQIADPGFTPMVRQILGKHSLNPEKLHLEITETAIMEASSQNIDRLNELASLGVHLSIDDFGTGYSNLALMTKLPVSNLKIDLSIVMAMDDQPGNLAVVKAVVTMARALGLDVVAEGVETGRQRDMLLELGCGLQQGYLHAHPLAVNQAQALLRNG
ncbi:MAG: EAL domain-containing protein [Desulfovibrio sp.]|nr:EAL domain-containing protein [Desulfovibrio sp.]MBI4959299.1 EAL domain-containing protein [Desulfovibrio sp.]